jgi:hypothetical protein
MGVNHARTAESSTQPPFLASLLFPSFIFHHLLILSFQHEDSEGTEATILQEWGWKHCQPRQRCPPYLSWGGHSLRSSGRHPCQGGCQVVIGLISRAYPLEKKYILFK